MWLKTADSSTACETSTLKSPLLLGSDAPHVHPRLRKRLARCTLDCGFKTSESPALRGFVAERAPIRGTSLYLVLKSNGLHHSENFPVKFGFSPQIVPANIVKKLPAQVLSQIVFHPDFQLPSQTPHVRFRGRKRVHTRLSEKNRTQGHTRRNRGRFGWGWYHYPRSVPHGSETLRGRGLKRQTLPLWGLGRGCSRRTQRAFGTAMRLCASLFRGVAAPLGCVIFSVSVEIAACTPCSDKVQ